MNLFDFAFFARKKGEISDRRINSAISSGKQMWWLKRLQAGDYGGVSFVTGVPAVSVLLEDGFCGDPVAGFFYHCSP